jgi:metal-sulfur cluster biosynthetic enzyme
MQEKPHFETRLVEAPEELREVGERIIEQLKSVYDPELPVNIYELGLILPPEVESKARAVEGVTSVQLDLVWDPPWTPELMSEAAKLDLGML